MVVILSTVTSALVEKRSMKNHESDGSTNKSKVALT
jgi:hypothetical protein